MDTNATATPSNGELTGTQQALITVLAGIFGSAAGTLLDDLEAMLQGAGGNPWQMVNGLVGSELSHQFFYDRQLSDAAFADAFLTHLFGPDDGPLVSSAAWLAARNWLTSRLESPDIERGQAMLELLLALHSVPDNDPVWGQAHQLFLERSALATELTQQLINTGSNHDTLDALLLSRELIAMPSLAELNGQGSFSSLAGQMRQLIVAAEQHSEVYHSWLPKTGGLKALQAALPDNAQLSDLLTFLGTVVGSGIAATQLIPQGGTDILGYLALLRDAKISLQQLQQAAQENKLQALLNTTPDPGTPPDPDPGTPTTPGTPTNPGTTPNPGNTPDTTPPSASLTAASVQSNATVQVKSTEKGTLYLVSDSISVSNLASITSAASHLVKSVSIDNANVNTPLGVSGLSDGTYRAYAVDAAGNLSPASSQSISIDNAAPEASLTAGTVAATGSVLVRSTEKGTLYLASDSLSVSHVASLTGATAQQVKSVAIAAANTDTTISVSGLSDGSYHAYAVDSAGNLSLASSAAIIVDGTAPTASLTGATVSANGSALVQSSEAGTLYLVKASLQVTNLASITSAASDQVKALTLSTANTPTALSVSGLSGGSYKAYAVDAAGNLSLASHDTLVIDTSAPSATVTAALLEPGDAAQVQSSKPGTAYLVKESVLVTGLDSITGAADNQVNSVLIGTANTPVALSTSGLSDGLYRLYTVDEQGNLSAPSSHTVRVEGSAPTASMVPATITPAGNVMVQSTETGTAYLVRDTVTVNSVSSIFAAGGNQFNWVSLDAENTPTELSAAGLIDGTYLVYTVDPVGRISAAANGTVVVDGTAPTLLSSTPGDDATGVHVGSNITLTFSETVLAGNGSIEIHKVSDDSVALSIPAGDAQVTISGNSVLINPAAPLDRSTGYYVQITDGAFKDQSGNTYAGISDKTSLNFTTSSAPADVIGTITHNGKTFGFLDANGNGVADTTWSKPSGGDVLNWYDISAKAEQNASIWRVATYSELLDMIQHNGSWVTYPGWDKEYRYWTTDGAGGHGIVEKTEYITNGVTDSFQGWVGVVLIG